MFRNVLEFKISNCQKWMITIWTFVSLMTLNIWTFVPKLALGQNVIFTFIVFEIFRYKLIRYDSVSCMVTLWLYESKTWLKNENWFFVWKFGCNHFPIHFVHKKLVFFFLSRQFLFVSGSLLPHLGNAFTLFFFLTRCIYLTRIWWKRNAKDIKLVCHYCQPLFSHIICHSVSKLFSRIIWI